MAVERATIAPMPPDPDAVSAGRPPAWLHGRSNGQAQPPVRLGVRAPWLLRALLASALLAAPMLVVLHAVAGETPGHRSAGVPQAPRTKPAVRATVTTTTLGVVPLPETCEESGTMPTQLVSIPTPGLPTFESGPQSLEADFPTIFGGVEELPGSGFTFQVFETVPDANFEDYARAVFGTGTVFAQSPTSLACLQGVAPLIDPSGGGTFDGIALEGIGYGADSLDVMTPASSSCEAETTQLEADLAQQFPGILISVTACVLLDRPTHLARTKRHGSCQTAPDSGTEALTTSHIWTSRGSPGR